MTAALRVNVKDTDFAAKMTAAEDASLAVNMIAESDVHGITTSRAALL